MHFAVWIVRPENDVNWQCLSEAADGVADGLVRLGHAVTVVVDSAIPEADRLIVFNGHRFTDSALPPSAIIFNSEQVPITAEERGPAWQAYLDRLKQHVVWDYSETNIARLNALGINRTALCRIGYYPKLSNIINTHCEKSLCVKDLHQDCTCPCLSCSPIEDVDVLFCGSMNDRRVKLLKEIASHRLITRVLGGVYGADRDRWIRRAKVVLNIHFYESPIWEIFRVSHLLANRKCVVSEDGGCDPVLESLAMRTTIHVPHNEIVNSCVDMVKNDFRRNEVGKRGFEVFSQIDQMNEVRLALEASL